MNPGLNLKSHSVRIVSASQAALLERVQSQPGGLSPGLPDPCSGQWWPMNTDLLHPPAGAPGQEGPFALSSCSLASESSLAFGCPWHKNHTKILGSSSAKDVGLSRTNQKQKTQMTFPWGHLSTDRLEGHLCPRCHPPCLTLLLSRELQVGLVGPAPCLAS